MLKKIWSIFLFFSEFFPIISIKEYDNNYYFSLINITFFNVFINIIFFDFGNKKFRVFKIIPVIENKIMNEETINKKVENYRNHLSFTPDSINLEKESLQYHINSENIRLSTSNGKASVLAAMLIVFISLTVYLFPYVKNFFNNEIYQNFFIVFFFYYFFETCFYILNFFYIKYLYQSRFSDLKDSENKVLETNIQLYYDWQRLKELADINGERIRVMFTLLIYIVILFFCVNFCFIFTKGEPDIKHQTFNNTIILNQNIKNTLTMFSPEHKTFETVLLQIESGEIDRIIMLYSSECESMVEIQKQIEEHNAKTQLLLIYDGTITEGIVKLILIKE